MRTAAFLSGAAAALIVALAGVATAAPPGVTSQSPSAELVASFGPGAELRVDRVTGLVRTARRLDLPVTGAGDDPGAAAVVFARAHAAAFGLGPGADVVAGEVLTTPSGLHVVRLDAVVAGVPVEGAALRVEIGADGHVKAVRSDLVPLAPPPPAAVTAEAARATVLARFDAAFVGAPRLALRVTPLRRLARAWRVPVTVVPLFGQLTVWVDATTGAVIEQRPAGFDQPISRLAPRGTLTLEPEAGR
ncbi:MAG: hypothetical protein KC635_23505 [Myxococcales bacterium]|nr:hypothetical protein [Myxococcales bacterium]MCB9735749.1 hypothetical protein [Deltaproteobacteria bacterium]